MYNLSARFDDDVTQPLRRVVRSILSTGHAGTAQSNIEVPYFEKILHRLFCDGACGAGIVLHYTRVLQHALALSVHFIQQYLTFWPDLTYLSCASSKRKTQRRTELLIKRILLICFQGLIPGPIASTDSRCVNGAL